MVTPWVFLCFVQCKSHHIPMDQIVKELREIEDCLGDLERKGVEMEKSLRSCEEGTFQ